MGCPVTEGMHWYGDLILLSYPEGFAEISVDPPQERDDNFRPTIYMERVATMLAESSAPLSQRTRSST